MAAERAKVDRIELCARLGEGGTTPKPELIRAVKERLRIPVFVMVRPRGGDFVYSRAELALMENDIRAAIDAGADGIVTGALTRDGRVEADAMRALMTAAGDRPVTFHRAFDIARSRSEALEDLATLEITRVLTSGGAPSASEGAEAIADLVRQSGNRVRIVAGGGVRAHNVGQLLERTRVREVHARLVDDRSMRELVGVVRAQAKTRIEG